MRPESDQKKVTGLLWIEAFPWVEARHSRFSESISSLDWSIPVRGARDRDRSEFKRRIDLIAESAIEERSTWSLTHLFPTVSPDLSFSDLILSVRTRNCLSHSQLSKFSNLQGWSIDELFSIEHMGSRSVSDLVQCLAVFATQGPALENDPAEEMASSLGPTSTGWHRSEESQDFEVEFDWALVASKLRTLASWQVAREQPNVPLLDTESTNRHVPVEVKEAARWLRELTAPQEAFALAEGVTELFETRLAELSDREVDVVTRRLLTDSPETLDSIGGALGVTRERIRQIESKALSKASSWLSEDTPLGLRAAAVRQLISPLCNLSKLLEQMPSLKILVSPFERPAWFVLDKFDDEFESDGVWVARPSIEEVAIETHAKYQEVSNAHGAAEIESVTNAFLDWTSISGDQLVEWFESLEYRSFKGHLISPSVRGLPDMTAAYLSIVGVSCSTAELYEAIGGGRSISSLKNALSTDSRFVRADRHDWALAEWGTRAYSNIRDMIGDIIAATGPVGLDSLIEELTSNFTISPRSIAAYANAWPFQTIRGLVSLAEKPRRTTKSLSESRNVYRHDESLQLRIAVNSEHLRGSGFAVPSGLAMAVGLEQGDKMFLSSGDIQVTLSWFGSQPGLGSIRSPLDDLDSAVGDQVMITIKHVTISFRKIEPRGESSASEFVGELLGIGSRPLESTSVAEALGLSANTPWPSIIHALRARGEHDLVELLIEHLGSDPVFSPDLAPSKFGGITIVEMVDRL